jgi:hypothetical protein
MIFAKPKSATFTRPRRSSKMFLRLDVAMDDALVVGELQRVANLRHDGQRLPARHASAMQQLPQAHAVHIFHEEEIQPIGAAKVIDGDDAGMVELGQRSRFARKALGKGCVLPDIRAAGS